MWLASYFKNFEERADLMGRMLETLGISRSLPVGPTSGIPLRKAAEACLRCRATRECHSWLDEQEIMGRTSEPTFCPNYGRFRQWQLARR